jgi:tRNA A37 methylthiotransferase MiaB
MYSIFSTVNYLNMLFFSVKMELDYPENKRFKNFYISCVSKKCGRVFESNRIHNYLVSNGISFTNNFKEAELIVISTCAVNKEQEDDTIRAIKYHIKRKAKNSKIVLVGCLPAISPASLQPLGDFEVIPIRELHKFKELIGSKIEWDSVSRLRELKIFPLAPFVTLFNAFIRDMHFLYRGTRADFSYPIRYLTKDKWISIKNTIRSTFSKHTQVSSTKGVYQLKVASGCLGNCSYCAIKFAIGNTKSVPINEIVLELREAIAFGYKHFNLSSPDVASYGLDIKTNFIELLKHIFADENDITVTLPTLHPKWLIRYYDDLIKIIKENPAKIKEIVIPIQSGSNRILDLMRRGYKIEEVTKYISEIKEINPEIVIKTHIIVGFPGETEEDFQASIDLIQKIPFSDISIHAYSNRLNTVASKMERKEETQVVHERCSIMENIQKKYGSCGVSIY